MTRVKLYSRRTCGLCDRARETILGLVNERPFSFEEIFVDGDDDLERAFGLRVPVVLVDGVETFEVEVSREDLREALEHAPGD